MPRHCPNCDADISDSYNECDPDVGVLCSSYYCEECDEAFDASDFDALGEDEVRGAPS